MAMKGTSHFALTVGLTALAACSLHQPLYRPTGNDCGEDWLVEVNNPFLFPVTATLLRSDGLDSQEIGTAPPDSKVSFSISSFERPVIGYTTDTGLGNRLRETAQGRRLRDHDGALLDKVLDADNFSQEQVRITIGCWED